MLAFEWCGINQQRAELLLLQPPLHQFLQLGPARFDEVFADRALLQAVRLAELPHRLAIFPRAQTEHEFLPYRLRQGLPAMADLVADQPDLPILGRTNSRPLDGHFLSHHDAVPALCAPPLGGPLRQRPVALTYQMPDFFFHQQLDHLLAVRNRTGFRFREAAKKDAERATLVLRCKSDPF